MARLKKKKDEKYTSFLATPIPFMAEIEGRPWEEMSPTKERAITYAQALTYIMQNHISLAYLDLNSVYDMDIMENLQFAEALRILRVVDHFVVGDPEDVWQGVDPTNIPGLQRLVNLKKVKPFPIYPISFGTSGCDSFKKLDALTLSRCNKLTVCHGS